MMLDNRRVAIVILVLTLGACGGRTGRTSPSDPFASVPLSQLPTGSLSGSKVLILAAGGVVLGDTAGVPAELEPQRSTILETANEALDSALRRDARDVTWMGLDEQRRAARRNPTLGLEPDRLPTAYLAGAEVERVPDPLWSFIRTLSAVTGARYAVVPAAVRVTGRAGAYVAEYVVVGADTRSGLVVYRGRTLGRPAADLRAAFASAAAALAATPLSQPRP
jgi:hypothetical protein